MFTVTVTTQDPKLAMTLLAKLGEANQTNATSVSVAETPKRTRQTKAKEVEESFLDEDQQDEEGEEEVDEIETSTLSVTPTDVVKAFKVYSADHGSEKARALAKKVTAKYEVKSLQDLNATQCAEVLKIVNSKK